MKKLFIIIILAVLTIPATAQQMVVEKAVGESEAITLDNLKQMTFDGTTVNIEQTDGSKSSIGMGDISRIYFGDLSSITGIGQEEERLVEYISHDEIAINSDAGSVVTVYSATGAQLLTKRLGSRAGTISIASLPRGIYIVQANSQTEKIIKR